MKKKIKKEVKRKLRPSSKEQLRRELIALNVTFTEKDGVSSLIKKLRQAQLPTKRDSSLPYVLFDAEDDQQILQELQGAVLDKFVYRFTIDGKDIVGLSQAGVYQACRESANRKGEVYRTIDDVTFVEEGEHVIAKAKAGRYKLLFDKKGNYKGEVLLDTAVGIKRQWKKMRRRDRTIVDDPFPYEKASTKAQRNARISLLPYAFITEMVKVFQKKGQEIVINANQKIGEAQMKFLHSLASHEELQKVIKAKFGYDSINELEMSQVQEVVNVVRKAIPQKINLPVELIGACNASNIMSGKRDAMWQKALQVSNNDIVKATALMKQEIQELF
jgi:hypothetical protein